MTERCELIHVTTCFLISGWIGKDRRRILPRKCLQIRTKSWDRLFRFLFRSLTATHPKSQTIFSIENFFICQLNGVVLWNSCHLIIHFLSDEHPARGTSHSLERNLEVRFNKNILQDNQYLSNNATFWHETGNSKYVAFCRWVKFQEDVEEGGKRWSKPFVPALQFTALAQLRHCLQEGVVMLDAPGEDLDEVIGK